MIIAFDLDGTLSDPIQGISASLNHALGQLGYPGVALADMPACIGPPLVEIFARIMGSDDPGLLDRAVALFRERYGRVGYSENSLYPGIGKLLEDLEGRGHTLYVATNKQTVLAQKVIDHFRLSRYFTEVLGSGGEVPKKELLAGIRSRESNGRFVMVGDRFFDMTAGRAEGYFCAGVLWGYGSRLELTDSGADCLVDSPPDLARLLDGME
jgi:phosphoglycolate phosphatase